MQPRRPWRNARQEPAVARIPDMARGEFGRKQIEDLRLKLADAQIECTVLKKNQSIKWFFTGGIVLLLGWLIGRLTGNSRKKKPSLLV